MSENGSKKREWVKTAAIIFLTVLLILTFFSNTIQNYSLPEVATQYVQSGTITAKIRGTGTIESGDPYEVKVTESRKVSSVAVKVGDTVQKGDILFYLADEESEELKTAQDALEAAQDAYDTALLTEAITAADIYSANKNVSTASLRQKITSAQTALKDAKAAVTPLQAMVDELEKIIGEYKTQITYEQTQDTNSDTRVTATTKALENAKNAQASAAANLTAAKTALETAQTNQAAAQQNLKNAEADPVSSGDASYIAALQQALYEADQKLTDATNDYNSKKEALDKANEALTNAQNDYNSAVSDNNGRQGSQTIVNLQSTMAAYQVQLDAANQELTAAKAAKEEAQTALTELVAQVGNVAGLEDKLEAITKAQEKVDELTAKSIGATITADIAGTVTSINVTAGNTTSAATPVAVLQPEGKGYSLSFSVTNDQAKKLSVGDQAELVNSWRYDDVTVKLASIKPDTTDPGQKKLLTFDVTGSVTAGQSLNISVGQKSASFDYIVPNSAVREDSNGKFILIVESKSSPLGNRYVATRVDVEVLASDDKQTAVSGGLYGYEYVITTSSAPVEAGKLVRLANN